MAEMVTDCPRCGASSITFDVFGDIKFSSSHGWLTHHEIAACCRRCHRLATFRADLTSYDNRHDFLNANSIRSYNGVINDVLKIEAPITARDSGGRMAPEYVPDPIPQIYLEGSSSAAAACYNAAGAMFRLCVDLATKNLLPAADDETVAQPNGRQRRELAYRLDWLFEQGWLPGDLSELARCIREHGNDGVHDGTLTKVDADDLMDFTTALLERLYTEPGRVAAARERYAARRLPPRPTGGG